MILIAICLFLLAFGLYSIVTGHKKLKLLRKYEFENRGSGGVVQFPDFEASNKHEAKMSNANLQSAFGVALFIPGIILAAIIIFSVFN